MRESKKGFDANQFSICFINFLYLYLMWVEYARTYISTDYGRESECVLEVQLIFFFIFFSGCCCCFSFSIDNRETTRSIKLGKTRYYNFESDSTYAHPVPLPLEYSLQFIFFPVFLGIHKSTHLFHSKKKENQFLSNQKFWLFSFDFMLQSFRSIKLKCLWFKESSNGKCSREEVICRNVATVASTGLHFISAQFEMFFLM